MAHKSLKIMDDRCPLGLNDFPTMPCVLAAERLRAIRNSPNDPKTERVGCDWYVNNRDANYCFFSYMHQNDGQGHDTIEIAGLLHETQAAVYDNMKKALEKVKEAGLGQMLLGEPEDEN